MTFLRIKTFIKSLAFHVWLGLPKATQQEINDRYKICDNCEDFNRAKQECNICGCAISTKSKFLNKLAWADQECPVSKWKKIIR